MSNLSKANICFECKKACGGCPWSAYDEKAKKVKFEEVEGWTAEPSILRNSNSVETHTYHITACPLFEPDGE